jgi:hypothetical protein
MELLRAETRPKTNSAPAEPIPGVGATSPPAVPVLLAHNPARVASPSPASTASSPPQPTSLGSPRSVTPGIPAALATGQPSVDSEGRVCVTTWFDFLVAADIPADAAREYERILLDNALEIDQLHELTLELLQSLGFRMGHLMRIMKTLECTEVIYPEAASPLPATATAPAAERPNFGSRAQPAPVGATALGAADKDRTASVYIPSSSSDALLHNIMSFGPAQQ